MAEQDSGSDPTPPPERFANRLFEKRAHRGSKLAAIAVLGSTAFATPLLDAAPATASTWYGNGWGTSSFQANYGCNGLFCAIATVNVTMNALVKEDVNIPSFNFYQDEFVTVFENAGPASPLGGCVYPGMDYVQHGNPNPYATWYGDTSWPGIFTTTSTWSSWYTKSYKEANVAGPRLTHTARAYNFPLVCPTYTVIQFTQIYKEY